LGTISTSEGNTLDVEITLEASPSVLYDAMVVPDRPNCMDVLRENAQALEFIREQYRHCKAILVVGNGVNLLAAADVSGQLPDGSIDLAIVKTDEQSLDDGLERFKTAMAAHRLYLRETDPPIV
jgi:catalase